MGAGAVRPWALPEEILRQIGPLDMRLIPAQYMYVNVFLAFMCQQNPDFRQEAIGRIDELCGWVVMWPIGKTECVHTVSLFRSQAEDGDLLYLQAFPKLSRLDLTSTRING